MDAMVIMIGVLIACVVGLFAYVLLKDRKKNTLEQAIGVPPPPKKKVFKEKIFEIDPTYLIRTVSNIVVGRLKNIDNRHILLTNCAWISDIETIDEFLKVGLAKYIKLNKPQFIENQVILRRGAVIEIVKYEIVEKMPDEIFPRLQKEFGMVHNDIKALKEEIDLADSKIMAQDKSILLLRSELKQLRKQIEEMPVQIIKEEKPKKKLKSKKEVILNQIEEDFRELTD